MKVWIDPPNGWYYGFPQVLDRDKETYEQLLRRSNYPEKDIDFALQYSRQWPAEGDVCVSS